MRKNDPNDTILRNVKQIGCPLHTSTNKALVNRNRISLDRRHTVVVGVYLLPRPSQGSPTPFESCATVVGVLMRRSCC